MSELLTRKQAAEMLGISTVTLDHERACGRLAYIQRKRGGKVWIKKTAIDEYLANGTHQAISNLAAVRREHTMARKRA